MKRQGKMRGAAKSGLHGEFTCLGVGGIKQGTLALYATALSPHKLLLPTPPFPCIERAALFDAKLGEGTLGYSEVATVSMLMRSPMQILFYSN